MTDLHVTATERAIVDPVLKERFAQKDRYAPPPYPTPRKTDEDIDALVMPMLPDTPQRRQYLLEWGHRAGRAALARSRSHGREELNPFRPSTRMPMWRGWEEGYKQR